MSNPTNRQRGLGRGLSALMADIEPIASEAANAGRGAKHNSLVPIEKIHPNPDQPRRHFDAEELNNLANSIRSKGVIQPLVVRVHPSKQDEYEIVAGERRWRASQKAQLHALPVVIRDLSDLDVLEIAIIENIQRSDLNPIEEASGFRQLMEKFSHTQEQMAEALGKSRPHIANSLRLLALPGGVQALVVGGRLSSGHARALITAPNASELAKLAVLKGLSVRQIEALVKQGKILKPAKKTAQIKKDADTKALEGDLSSTLKMMVSIEHLQGEEGGTLTVKYKSLDQLDELCRQLGGT